MYFVICVLRENIPALAKKKNLDPHSKLKGDITQVDHFNLGLVLEKVYMLL